MRLYFLDISPPCRAVSMVMQTLSVSAELVETNLYADEHLKPEFLKINPMHSLPTLDDSGFILCDSHAISTYLISKYAEDDTLYPKDLQTRAKVDEQLHYHNEVFSLFRSITIPVIRHGNKQVSDENKNKLLEACAILEKILEKQNYIVGNELTIADIHHISVVPSFSAYIPMTKDKFPHLHAWMARCSSNIKNYKEANARGCEEMTNAIIQKLNAT